MKKLNKKIKHAVLVGTFAAASFGTVISCNQLTMSLTDDSNVLGNGNVPSEQSLGDGIDKNNSSNFNYSGCIHSYTSDSSMRSTFGQSAWSAWEYVGVVNGNHSHRSRCAICGTEYIEPCQSTSGCNQCNRKGASSDIAEDAKFITINEQITKLVIVANDEFRNSEALKKYIEYKRKRNFTVVDKYYKRGHNANEIRSELKKEYELTQNMAVLIVGRGVGAQPYSIPEFVNKNHPTLGGHARTVATDFYYGYYEDGHSDLFPQIAVGRLSARNENDLEYQVKKIMEMESGNKTASNNIVLVQHKTDSGKTYFDDEPRDIKKHLNTFNEKYSYSVRQTYTNEPSGIASAINEGTLLVVYTGHGQETSWGDSKFGIPNVNGLKNTVYPIVLGVTCNSANFTYGDGCIAEAFMRNPHGAVGYIGASAVMIADYSKVATIGQEVPGMINSLITDDERYKVKTLGGLFLSALRRIKMSRTFYGDQEYKDYSIEVLNLFGDPTMSIEYITK